MSHLIVHLIDGNADTAYFRSLARFADRASFPVAIGSLAEAGPLQQAMASMGVPSFALGTKARTRYPWAAVRLSRLLRTLGAGILHAHCFDPTAVGLIAARIAGVPFVFTRHHSDHNLRLNKRWHTRIDAYCARHAQRVIAVSEATRRVLVDVEHVPSAHISVVYNGMEPLATPDAAALCGLRRSLGIEGDTRVCLTVARLHEEKGHAVLFQAIPRILAEAGPAVFLLAGDGPHRQSLQNAAARIGITTQVRFLGSRRDIPELLAVADVAILPSLAESFGFAALEAMSAGVPVVAAATGGLAEVVLDGQTGLLVKPGDADALAAATLGVLKDRDLAAALGRSGRARVGLFGAERMVRGYEEVYRSLWPDERWQQGDA